MQVSFAGDTLYKPSLTGIPVTVYLSTSFVVWGGNAGGIRLGQDVNFWGHSWSSQVTAGNFDANASFKGFADPVNQIHVCEASAGTGGPLDDLCWSSKPGNSFPPPLTLPAYIEVIISTAIAKHGAPVPRKRGTLLEGGAEQRLSELALQDAEEPRDGERQG